jgi:heme iron utilization protein
MLTLADQAKTVLLNNTQATLSTISGGFPFGSLVNYTVWEHQPILLLSKLAEHTQNLLADNKVSLFVTRPNPRLDAMEWARLTLLGEAHLAEPKLLEQHSDEQQSLRQAYLEQHPKASLYVDFPDFSFYQIRLQSVRFVGGFGSMGWISVPDFWAATSDPVATLSEGVIEHMNADHCDAMQLIARHQLGQKAPAYLLGSDQAHIEMISVDQSGYELRMRPLDAKQGGDEQRLRVQFQSECRTSKELRLELVRQTNLAREALESPSAQ